MFRPAKCFLAKTSLSFMHGATSARSIKALAIQTNFITGVTLGNKNKELLTTPIPYTRHSYPFNCFFIFLFPFLS